MQSSYSFLKIVLLLVVTFCLTFQVNAQSTGFAPLGAEWHYEIRHPFDGAVEFSTINVVGDTIIAGKVCRILIKENRPGCYGGAYIDYIYEEDSVVYFYDSNFDAFQILYDYTANQGEYWSTKVPAYTEPDVYDSIQLYIDSIKYEVINDKSLKALYVTMTHSYLESYGFKFRTIIYEKIGSYDYLQIYFDRYFGLCDDQYSYGLRCYEDSEFGLYETGLAATCDTTYILTSVTESELENDFKLYPNPAKDFLYLDINSNDCLSQPTSINVYNALGGLILQNIKTQCGLNAIEVNNLSPGIYYLQCNQNGQIVFSQKVIIE
ncbi:MAG: T9SS type A sorting domain-containing protein [Chitinophagales bacterium]|nr:T9SS type A sorting domain-containing protein [Chitinophagales bacterium]MBP9548699.1 T9SS type A sorting domain-containing protein [Chitinophagales bacterium]MBP9705729.1 T9SS type A sorting domain-containing protein [Chitinophagales bacterium]